MLGNKKILFDEIYEKTKDCGRVQFVKLLMTKEKENQELKKQLEEYKGSQSCSFVNICKNVKIANYIQQKEFIKYLEDEIQKKRKKSTTLTSFTRNVLPLQHCLQKYKEIIGDDK